MCRYISAFHHPVTGEIRVADLDSHGETERILNLDPAGPFREMHYLPDGYIECRVQMEDVAAGFGSDMCADRVKQQWPTFEAFEAWAVKQPGVADLREARRIERERRQAEREAKRQRWLAREPQRIKERERRAKRAAAFLPDWASGRKSAGKWGKMSHSCGVMYSYGWWPIGKIVGRYYLCRDQKYSVTTSGHQRAALSAAVRAKKRVVYVCSVGTNAKSQAKNLTWYTIRIQEAKNRLSLAQADWVKQGYENRIQSLRLSRRRYVRLCGQLKSEVSL